MKLLTFVTVVTGMPATIAGILGMSFDAGLFASTTFGLGAAVALTVVLGLVAVAIGRQRTREPAVGTPAALYVSFTSSSLGFRHDRGPI